MKKTIYTALSPLLITGSLCGLNFFEYPPGRIRPYLSCLYFFITWSLIAYMYSYLVQNTYVAELFLSWPVLIVETTAMASTFISLFYFKKLKRCLHELSLVDNTLEELGIPKEYQQLYKWMIRVVIGWILLVLLMNTMDSIWFDYKNFNYINICLPFVGNHFLHVSTISDLTCGTILGYTGTRFRRINKHIHNLLEDNIDNTGKKKTLTSVDDERDVIKCNQFVWIIMHIHLQLCRISCNLNEVFSIHMTLKMASYFTFLLHLFQEFFMLYLSEKKSISHQIIMSLLLYFWGGIYIIKLIALNYICQNIYDKANETMSILYKLSNNSLDKDLHEQISQFILQIKQRQIKISGMRLFYFGHNFIRKFFTSVTTVLVIIIQFQTSNNVTQNEMVLFINARD